MPVDTHKVRKIFDHFDTDNSGALDVVEMQSLVNQLGVKLSVADCGIIIAKMDENRNGLIEYSEFENWWKHTHKKRGRSKRTEINVNMEKLLEQLNKFRPSRTIKSIFLKKERLQSRKAFEIKKMFIEFDVDGNGVLDRGEFRQLALAVGLPLLQVEADGIFDSIDTDKSGLIEFEEFYEWYVNGVMKESGDKLSFSIREALRRKQEMRENGTNDVRLASSDDKSGGLRMSGKKDIIVKEVVETGGKKVLLQPPPNGLTSSGRKVWLESSEDDGDPIPKKKKKKKPARKEEEEVKMEAKSDAGKKKGRKLEKEFSSEDEEPLPPPPKAKDDKPKEEKKKPAPATAPAPGKAPAKDKKKGKSAVPEKKPEEEKEEEVSFTSSGSSPTSSQSASASSGSSASASGSSSSSSE